MMREMALLVEYQSQQIVSIDNAITEGHSTTLKAENTLGKAKNLHKKGNKVL